MGTGRRILTNAVAMYGRSLLVLFLVLFSSRWILLALGAVDFGLFGVVGSITVFITFLNTVMSMSAARHLAFAMGECRKMPPEAGADSLKRWFNASLSIHIVVPAVLVLVGYPVGVYAVRHWLTIPPDRVAACVWVFRFSVLTAFVSMSTVPFSAIYLARQKIAEQSAYDVLSSILNFVFAYSLLRYQGDGLCYYACYKMGISVLVSTVFVTRALVSFPETRVNVAYWWDRDRVRQLLGYASWNFFGALGWMVKDQGLYIIANKAFGPVVNAAMSVAGQVSGQVTALANSVMSALTPEITSTEGAGDHAKTVRIAFTSCRMAALLCMVFMIPLCFEMQYVLNLWLKNPPAWSALFCQLTLLGWFLHALSTGHAIAMGAVGKIRDYQLSIGGGMILCLPVAWTCCHYGLPPWCILVVSVLTMAFCSFGRVLWAKPLAGMAIGQWFREVFNPVALSCALVSMPLALLVWLLPSNFFRLCLVSAVGGLGVVLTGWIFVLRPEERNYFVVRIKARVSIK